MLHSQKSPLLVAARLSKHVDLDLIIMGVLGTLMILLAPIEIPLIGIGWWMRLRGAKSVEIVEAGCAEFTSAVAA